MEESFLDCEDYVSIAATLRFPVSPIGSNKNTIQKTGHKSHQLPGGEKGLGPTLGGQTGTRVSSHAEGSRGGAGSCFGAAAASTHPSGPVGDPGLCLCSPPHALPLGPAASLSVAGVDICLPCPFPSGTQSKDLVGCCVPGPRARLAAGVGVSAGPQSELTNTVVTGHVCSTSKGRAGVRGDSWRHRRGPRKRWD